MKTQTNKHIRQRSILGNPRKFEQYETTSCVIPSFIFLNNKEFLPFITCSVQTYDDSGIEITRIIIQELPKVQLLDDDSDDWCETKGVFRTDVLEQIRQTWEKSNTPDDILDNYERNLVNSPSEYIDMSTFTTRHRPYEEQQNLAWSFTKNYYETIHGCRVEY